MKTLFIQECRCGTEPRHCRLVFGDDHTSHFFSQEGGRREIGSATFLNHETRQEACELVACSGLPVKEENVQVQASFGENLAILELLQRLGGEDVVETPYWLYLAVKAENKDT